MKNKKYYTVGTKWKTKNSTLSEQNEKQKYYIVGTKWTTKTNISILSEQNEIQKKYYPVGTKWKTKEYYAVGTKWKTKNTILSEQNEKQI